ncbi:putative FERM, RhoGEF and pleckstrin domain protein 2 [Operophtera brumata]|uniref:Putative FERM, RhoGEF and pleckstrin domain protein 2 n=1 Tax=Operophtera brumata TaxID=104452 RepID=A0A0L7KZJ4_OPEBR|nr:putative FERM, RhoGEF and pleckstrin domain protein 2 [Operophtera brumata]
MLLYETSPEEDNTISSASLCMSPAPCDRTEPPAPLCASTPYARPLTNGHDLVDEAEEPEYKKIAELLYDYLTTTAEAYTSYIERSATLVGLFESVRRSHPAVSAHCAAFDAASPLPLACLLLRPLHRTLHLERLAAVSATNDQEWTGWCNALEQAIEYARERELHVDTELTPYEQEINSSSSSLCTVSGNSLAHVCWHRVTSLAREHLHLAMRVTTNMRARCGT